VGGRNVAHPPPRRQGAVGRQLLYPGEGRPQSLYGAILHRAGLPLDAEGPALPDANACDQLRGSGVREDRRERRHGPRGETQDGSGDQELPARRAPTRRSGDWTRRSRIP
jgi:hypothetical protein